MRKFNVLTHDFRTFIFVDNEQGTGPTGKTTLSELLDKSKTIVFDHFNNQIKLDKIIESVKAIYNHKETILDNFHYQPRKIYRAADETDYAIVFITADVGFANELYTKLENMEE